MPRISDEYPTLLCLEESGCETRQSFREDKDSTPDVFRRRVFIRTVAVSIAARNKQHRDRSNARHKQRVMIRAADHWNEIQSVLFTRLRKRFHNRWSTLRRRVRVQHFFVNLNMPPPCYRFAHASYHSHHRIAPLEICVSYIHTQMNATGDAVDRAGKYFTDTYGCHGIHRTAAARRIFDRQDQFRRRA